MLKPNIQRGEKALLLSQVHAVALLVQALVAYWRYSLLIAYYNGSRSPIFGVVTDELVSWSDSIEGIIALVMLVPYVGNAITFILWFRRAYYNLHVFFPEYPSYAEKSAATCWFIPIVNLFRPIQIMKDLWRGTLIKCQHYTNVTYPGGVINIWFICWIAFLMLDRIAATSERKAIGIDAQATSELWYIAGCLTGMCGLIAMTYIMKQYMRIERTVDFAFETDESSIFGQGELLA